MSRTLLKVAGEQNDPLRVKVFPHDFVDKPLLKGDKTKCDKLSSFV